MSPYDRLINESIPTGTYGDADHSPWTPAEQLAHRLVLEEAIDGWSWADDPRTHTSIKTRTSPTAGEAPCLA